MALALATPALAQQTGPLSDFELPPDPDATPTPEVQGPVDPEAAVRTAPRVIPTETPALQPSPTPTLTLPVPSPSPTPTRPAQTDDAPEPEPAPIATSSPEPATTEPAPLPTEFAPSVPLLASTPDAAVTEPVENGGSLIPWLAALVAALGLAGGAVWYFRRREELAPVPAIEPPLARPQPQPDSGEAPPAAQPASPSPPPIKSAPSSPVTLQAQPVRMSRSMMNATFAFRLVLENQSLHRWENLSIEADLVTAHGAAPVTEQLAAAAVALAPLNTVETLDSGGTAEIAGEVRLPLEQVRAIRQGRAAVYVPLLRVRVVANGKQPLARTFLIGQLPDREGGRLRPFRLDEMPQSYQAIGLRPLD